MVKPKLRDLFDICVAHQKEHLCGGHPYQHADMLQMIVRVAKAKRILEIGTGLGYTAAAMALVDKTIQIETVDQNEEHSSQARKHWETYGTIHQITQYIGKAEVILPTVSSYYDLIFFDGYAPSIKFMIHFEKLIKQGGIIVSANLFVKNELGGVYVRELKKSWKWQSGFFSDTAISVKLR